MSLAGLTSGIRGYGGIKDLSDSYFSFIWEQRDEKYSKCSDNAQKRITKYLEDSHKIFLNLYSKLFRKYSRNSQGILKNVYIMLSNMLANGLKIITVFSKNVLKLPDNSLHYPESAQNLLGNCSKNTQKTTEYLENSHRVFLNSQRILKTTRKCSHNTQESFEIAPKVPRNPH